MAAKNIDPLDDGISNQSIEGGAQDWVNSCGVCHVGGGQMEYDRDMNAYSATSPSGDYYVFNYPTVANPNPVAPSPGFMDAGNKAEMDCLMCHLGDTKHGQAFLQSLGCSDTMPLGPTNDANCDGVTDPGFPAAILTAGPYTPATAYDMFNRNLGLKSNRLDLAASMGIGAKGVWNPDGTLAGIDWGAAVLEIPGSNIVATPKSANCSVCHARDDNTPGLTGMMAMKYGYGNYALMFRPGQAHDTDSADNLNDVFWYDLGCKTGMGKRTHKIGVAGDYVGPNGRHGMSMFLRSTLDDDPLTEPNMGDTIDGKMPDVDVHDADGMSCATCHYALGSIDKNHDDDGDTGLDSRLFPAAEHHGVPYPDEVVYGWDHQFAQPDSYPDTKSKNNLDGTVSCESCHTTRTHPRLTDNGGPLDAPTPTHAAFPQLHFDKIACATCHIPEVYGAPGRLKYRDWSVGFYKGTFRNMLDWNFDLVTGSHRPMPVLRKWVTKYHETKIYPVLPSVMPIWVEAFGNSLVEAGSGLGVPADPNGYPMGNPLLSPVKSRDTVTAALAVQAANPQFDIRINGGNVVPLFDGFSLADSWEIDKKAEIDAMIASFTANTPANVKKLKLFQADFDVTHGVVPKEWALGGAARGGCQSCHSSADPADPNYSPDSVAFFEGKIQPLDNAGMGIGGYDMIKNWFGLFADYDCTAMCDPAGMNDAAYFNPMTNTPTSGAPCTWNTSNGGMFDTIDQCIDMMTGTFDGVMGFPAAGTCDPGTNTCNGGAYNGMACGSDADCPGTARAMGMWDGIAGLQGFTIREPVAGGTLGCNPFAGPVYRSPVAGQSVNNCVPAGAPFDGTCVGADPANEIPGGCSGGFRDGGDCMTSADCSGVITDAAELAQNPNGLLYQRADVRSHFKIDLQQSIDAAGSKVTWPVGGGQNPGNPAHVNKWDQANYCWDYSTGNPMAPGVKPCADGDSIANVVPANAYLGYSEAFVSILKQDQYSPYLANLDAKFTGSQDPATSLQVNLDAAASKCPSTCDYEWDFGDDTTGAGLTTNHIYSAPGDYEVTLKVTDQPTGYYDMATQTMRAVEYAPPLETTVTPTQTDNLLHLDIVAGVDTILAKLYVYWGDGTRDIITDPALIPAAMDHTYTRNGTFYCKVYVFDSYGQRTNFVFTVPVTNL